MFLLVASFLYAPPFFPCLPLWTVHHAPQMGKCLICGSINHQTRFPHNRIFIPTWHSQARNRLISLPKKWSVTRYFLIHFCLALPHAYFPIFLFHLCCVYAFNTHAYILYAPPSSLIPSLLSSHQQTA
ncbi:hypothetical protein BCR43DRAFT_48021 [Syncephalastrum racemosum]|uniref:Secreted protein n=1 Tax=Syncephalastrum racemosum TaxID=13706 RepID=A0A1X2HUZ8_SYNRA|nr:hypothetical protein BCR43DRAFT_48021 [Syncephalastrum racemosum]